jgi:hypothetical protein
MTDKLSSQKRLLCGFLLNRFWCEGMTGTFDDKAVDMTLRLDNATALSTCPQAQQQQQTALIAA